MSFPSDCELRKVLEAILDECEITVGYEDHSNILPINTVSGDEAIPRIIEYIKGLFAKKGEKGR